MIPRIIHYCWFGHGEMPELVTRCIASWHTFMPDWEYRLWDENNFDIDAASDYVREAYAARKYAFVSDYVRLWALEREGGVYLDTDVEVIRPFDELLNEKAFIGFEESKAKTLGTNVIGSEFHMSWLRDLLKYYNSLTFANQDGTLNMTPNSEIIAQYMTTKGLIRDGREQIIEGIHIFDFHHFSPITSTRVMRKTKDTYSIHHCYASWQELNRSHCFMDCVIVREVMNVLVQLKRKSFG